MLCCKENSFKVFPYLFTYKEKMYVEYFPTRKECPPRLYRQQKRQAYSEHLKYWNE